MPVRRSIIAATAVLTLGPARGITSGGDIGDGVRGYQFFGTVFAQEFLVAVSDDAGQPVTGCLGTGGQVRLVNARTGAELGRSSCALGDGRFHIFPNPRIEVPTGVVAVVDPSVLPSGVPVSAVNSNGVIIVIAPKIVNTSPGFNPGRVFPIRGVVEAARPNTAGVLALEQRVKNRWVRKQVRPIPRSGRFEFKVRGGGRYRVHFLPKKDSGYVESYLTLRIRRV